MMYWKGSGRKRPYPNRVGSQNLPGRAEENHQKPQERADVPGEIRTEKLHNTGPQRYEYVNPSGICLLYFFII
jgi:hypothetical protein